jgi:hypothetical protein
VYFPCKAAPKPSPATALTPTRASRSWPATSKKSNAGPASTGRRLPGRV